MSGITPPSSDADRARWDSEASFFDAGARRAEDLQLSLEVLRRVVQDFQVRPFHLFARFTRYLLPNNDFEPAAAWRRALVRGIWIADYDLLSLPGISALGGYAVLSCTVRH